MYIKGVNFGNWLVLEKWMSPGLFAGTTAEDEYYVTIDHEMSKSHYISFIAAVQSDGCEIRKLYPEGPAEARFKTRLTKHLYYYCNRHGLFDIEMK